MSTPEEILNRSRNFTPKQSADLAAEVEHLIPGTHLIGTVVAKAVSALVKDHILMPTQALPVLEAIADAWVTINEDAVDAADAEALEEALR